MGEKHGQTAYSGWRETSFHSMAPNSSSFLWLCAKKLMITFTVYQTMLGMSPVFSYVILTLEVGAQPHVIDEETEAQRL